jgi:hypothetical protein
MWGKRLLRKREKRKKGKKKKKLVREILINMKTEREVVDEGQGDEGTAETGKCNSVVFFFFFFFFSWQEVRSQRTG